MRGTTFGVALTTAIITGASVVVLLNVVDVVVIIGAVVIGAIVVGETVTNVVEVVVVLVLVSIVGATVVGATVVGAIVVGANVVGAIVVGAMVVGATVVGATVTGAVVVGTTFRVAIALAVAIFDCVPMPNWPWSLSPQQRTSPVDITAHAWLVPATTSTTVPVSPVTAPGVSRVEPIEPEPN